MSEALAEELQLKEVQELTIAGAGGSLVKKQSKQVTVITERLNNKFSESANVINVSANVINDIAGDTPAFNWADLKSKWLHLYSVPFEKTNRCTDRK